MSPRSEGMGRKAYTKQRRRLHQVTPEHCAAELSPLGCRCESPSSEHDCHHTPSRPTSSPCPWGHLTLSETPKHIRQHNIRTGYRRHAVCCSPHNEFINTWSHLLSAGLALYNMCLDTGCLPNLGPGVAPEHQWMFLASGMTAVVCFLCSATMHHFGCHANASESTLRLLLALDHAGISIGIMGPYIPGLALGFWCYPSTRLVYLCGIALVSAATISLQLHPRWSCPEWQLVRVATFGCAIAFAFVPLTHELWIATTSQMEYNFAIDYMPNVMLSLVFMVIGCWFFVSEFPEKHFPRRFDTLGASHQIWHIFVVATIFNQHYGALEALEARVHGPQCPA